MSTSIFHFMPQLIDYSAAQEYSTLISNFENGMEQRRKRFARPIGSWKFNFSASLYSPENRIKIEDEIQTFFNARSGSYDNFYLPSWEMEVVLDHAITGGATTITLGMDPSLLGFSATEGTQGNYIYLCSNWYLKPGQSITEEIRRITTIAYSTPHWIITVTPAITNSYSVGAHLQKAHLVRFVNDKLEKGHKMPYVWESPIEFVEDIGGLYA